MTVEFVAVEEPVEESEVVIQGVPASAGVGGCFTFVQDDELEAEQEQEAEPSDEDVEIVQTVTDVNIGGHHIVEETLTITTTHEVGDTALSRATSD